MRLAVRSRSLDRMRVLQGDGLDAVQYDPAADTDPEFMDARRAGGEDEVLQVRQASRAILSREAERRAGICEGILRVLAPMRVRYLKVLEGQNSSTRTIAQTIPHPIHVMFGWAACHSKTLL
jgi:hypothetical protein